MKKYSLLKTIGVVTIIFMLLTWLIPIGMFVDGSFSNNGYNPMGIFDLLLLPFTFFSWGNVSKLLLTNGVDIELVSHIGTVLAIISIGIFYKVLNKTGAYGNLVEKIVSKLNNNKTLFIVLSIVMFTLISSLTGLSLLLLLLVPFFITVLLKLKFSRITSLASTILPILVGRICSITAWDVTGVNNVVYGIGWNDNLIVRVILLIIFMVLTSIYVLISKSPCDEEAEDPMYDDIVIKERSYVPIIVLTSIFFAIMAICMYNWYYVFNNTSVTEAYETIMSNSISGYPFVNNLLGSIEPFGYWTGMTMSAILFILSGIFIFIYSLTFEEFIDSIKKGIKSMGYVAFCIILASAIMTFINNKAFINQVNSNIFYTIAEWINKHISFETIPFTSLLSGIYGVFINDYSAMALQTVDILENYFMGGAYNLAVLCMQTIYGIISLVTPTSILLIAGLAYLNIPYKKWISYIWKLFLILLALAISILLIASLL